MNPKTTIEKLQILLPHWIEHNQKHAAEYETWAAAVQAEGAENLAAWLRQSAAHMAATDELLKQAVAKVGAPAEPHHH